MKYLLLIFFFITLGLSSSIAQHENDSIVSEDNNYYYKGKQVYYYDFKNMMSENPQASKSLKIANFYKNAGELFVYTGTYLIGYSIWDIIMKDEHSLTLTAIGGGILMGAIVCSVAYKNQIQNAVDIYNSGILSDSGNGVKLEFGGTKNGIGFVCKF